MSSPAAASSHRSSLRTKSQTGRKTSSRLQPVIVETMPERADNTWMQLIQPVWKYLLEAMRISWAQSVEMCVLYFKSPPGGSVALIKTSLKTGHETKECLCLCLAMPQWQSTVAHQLLLSICHRGDGVIVCSSESQTQRTRCTASTQINKTAVRSLLF